MAYNNRDDRAIIVYYAQRGESEGVQASVKLAARGRR